MSDMPEHERPLSERYRVAGRDWAEAQKTALHYEKRKDIVLDELVLSLLECAKDNGERLSKTHAESEARTSKVWIKYIDEMLEARHAANLARVEVEALDLEHSEAMQRNANARDERRSYRMGGAA